jgi:predicted transcriptional regulator
MLTLRLSPALEARLNREAERRGATKSTLARQAIVEFLQRLERKAELEGMAAEARAYYGDPVHRAEAQEWVDADLGEGPDDDPVSDPANPWWR